MNGTLVTYMATLNRLIHEFESLKWSISAPTTHIKKVGKYGFKVLHKRNYDRLWK